MCDTVAAAGTSHVRLADVAVRIGPAAAAQSHLSVPGERLPLTQDEVVLRGHAVEARVYAEDPAAGFLPTGGRVVALRDPSGPGVRVDSGVAEGGVVGSDYDPMLAKIVAHGADRAEALRRLDAALRDTVLLGLGTNIGFLRALLADADVRAGDLDTGLVGRRAQHWAAAELPADVLAAAAGIALRDLEPEGPVVDPFDVPGGWRVGEPAWTRWGMLVSGHDPVDVRARGRAASAEVVVGEAEPVRVRVHGNAATHARKSGDSREVGVTVDGGAGNRLVVVEAMKMEHVLTALLIVEPAVVEPAPVEPAPVEPALVNPAPVDPGAVEPKGD